MPDTKISAFGSPTTRHGDNLFPLVDVHDTSMASSGTDRCDTLNGMLGSPTTGQLLYWSGAASGMPAGTAELTIGAAGQLNFASISAPGSPSVGDEWYDSGQSCRAFYAGPGGLVIYRQGLVYSQTADTSATATGTLVSTSGAAGGVALPAGLLNVAGRTLRIKAGGYVSTAASGQGSIGFYTKLGSNYVANMASGSLAASRSNVCWSLELITQTKVTGSSGKLDSTGSVVSTSMGTSAVYNLANASGSANVQAPATQVTVDLTAAYTLDFGVYFSASSGNTVNLTNLIVEILA